MIIYNCCKAMTAISVVVTPSVNPKRARLAPAGKVLTTFQTIFSA